MRATSIVSDATRIIPAIGNKPVEATKNAGGSMTFKLANGTSFTLDAEDKELQAFVIWTMANDYCTK